MFFILDLKLLIAFLSKCFVLCKSVLHEWFAALSLWSTLLEIRCFISMNFHLVKENVKKIKRPACTYPFHISGSLCSSSVLVLISNACRVREKVSVGLLYTAASDSLLPCRGYGTEHLLLLVPMTTFSSPNSWIFVLALEHCHSWLVISGKSHKALPQAPALPSVVPCNQTSYSLSLHSIYLQQHLRQAC